jgi:catalase
LATESKAHLPYNQSLEHPQPDEHVVFDELSRTMQHITRTMAGRYRHAYRPVYAKSHGIVVGRLEIAPGLPEHLAQGLFAVPLAHPVILRFSTNPGDLLADNVSSPRGLAVKILNVDGEKVANHSGQPTKDLVFINTNAFSAPNPGGFLEQLKIFDKNLKTSEGVKHAVSVAARATNAVLKVVHLPSGTLEGIGASATHILGESFSTVAPLRYGSYVAKIGIAPSSGNLKKLTGKAVDLGADYNALEELIKHFVRNETAVWEVKAQLALEPADPTAEEKDKEFPIEKADKVWPEDKSPWQTLGSSPQVPKTFTLMPGSFSWTNGSRSARGTHSKIVDHWAGLCGHD